ncbi:unnamed protein product [Nippostrongylus brasiliensis]|uniref:Expressed conserved protein n=1 Tax=Nippostrongylus brasiliensis TaxID=27835 RepID=A0A0N4Y2V4_NIPBR|nr:unnamed protein product [Nippostrongylus brasiliensis]
MLYSCEPFFCLRLVTVVFDCDLFHHCNAYRITVVIIMRGSSEIFLLILLLLVGDSRSSVRQCPYCRDILVWKKRYSFKGLSQKPNVEPLSTHSCLHPNQTFLMRGCDYSCLEVEVTLHLSGTRYYYRDCGEDLLKKAPCRNCSPSMSKDYSYFVGNEIITTTDKEGDKWTFRFCEAQDCSTAFEFAARRRQRNAWRKNSQRKRSNNFLKTLTPARFLFGKKDEEIDTPSLKKKVSFSLPPTTGSIGSISESFADDMEEVLIHGANSTENILPNNDTVKCEDPEMAEQPAFNSSNGSIVYTANSIPLEDIDGSDSDNADDSGFKDIVVDDSNELVGHGIMDETSLLTPDTERTAEANKIDEE